MKKLVGLLSLTILVASCGGSEFSTECWPATTESSGIRVSGNLLEDEALALSKISCAITLMGLEPQDAPIVIFIRDPSQKVPEMCGTNGCCDVWKDCPDALGVKERVKGEGFSGLQRGCHVFVSRIGDRVNKLESLLVHEFSHWACDCDHGQEQKNMEAKIKRQMEADECAI